MTSYNRWFKQKTPELPTAVFSYVQEVERSQSLLFERFYKLGALYDPYYSLMTGSGGTESSNDRRVNENVIAASVDTVVAIISTAEVRPRVLIDEGDWTAHRTAARLSWYAEGLGKVLNVHTLAVAGFKDAAMKGTGLVKVYIDWQSGDIVAERVLVDDIIVDEGECRTGKPSQMHQRKFVDREQLKAAYPEHEEEIQAAQSTAAGDGSVWSNWADYRPIERDQVVVVESWHLPVGRKGRKGYKAGRHCICIDQAVLFDDEEWEKTFFPFAVLMWSTRAHGWYGIGGAERIAGHQRRVNKLHWQTDRALDQVASPTTYVHISDANLAVKTQNKLGTIAPYKHSIPKTVIPQAVSPEVYGRLAVVADKAFEEFGVSKMTATAKKPAGLDSGAAIREYHDATTQRFAQQEEGFEQFELDIIWRAIDCAKDLSLAEGESPPVIIRKLSKGKKKLSWSNVDPGEVKIQLQAASTLARTPAGRTQMVLEWAQAGIISQDEARSMMGPFDPLDLESPLSLYSSKLRDLQLTIEDLLDGEVVVPEPFQDLALGIYQTQMAYLGARGDGAPEEILENIRQWTVQAAFVLSMQEPAMAAPEAGTPTTALAPEAPLAGV